MAFQAAFQGIFLALHDGIAQEFAVLLMHEGAARERAQRGRRGQDGDGGEEGAGPVHKAPLLKTGEEAVSWQVGSIPSSEGQLEKPLLGSMNR
jgi:hypothetical protein